MSIANMSKADRRKRAIELLETVGLKDRVNHKPAELSGGQQQRVAIARALANNPKFLLLDEPTGNIDSKTASEVLALIKKLNIENNVSIIMVTHDQHLAREAKRTVQMFDGEITSEVVNTKMKTIDIFGYSFSAIKLRKLRAALTTLGVIIGIAAIVALLSITQGLQATITGQLNQGLSANTLIVTPGSGGVLGGGGGGQGGGGFGGGGGGGGGGFGGGTTDNSGFKLYVNYTSEIDALSPDIVTSIAIISGQVMFKQTTLTDQ